MESKKKIKTKGTAQDCKSVTAEIIHSVEIYLCSTEGVTVHLTDPTFAVNISGDIGGPVSSILANVFSLRKPKRGQDTKIIDMHGEKTANFVAEFWVVSVQTDKHVIAAHQVAIS